MCNIIIVKQELFAAVYFSVFLFIVYEVMEVNVVLSTENLVRYTPTLIRKLFKDLFINSKTLVTLVLRDERENSYLFYNLLPPSTFLHSPLVT